MRIGKLDNLELPFLIEPEDILLCRHGDRRNQESCKKYCRLDFHSNISMFQVDVFVRDEIESVNILSDFLVGGNNPCCLFKGSSETMMMIMSLEPVVMVIPVGQVTQITDLHHPSAFFIAVFFHPCP
jgi:hypothetical protein